MIWGSRDQNLVDSRFDLSFETRTIRKRVVTNNSDVENSRVQSGKKIRALADCNNCFPAEDIVRTNRESGIANAIVFHTFTIIYIMDICHDGFSLFDLESS